LLIVAVLTSCEICKLHGKAAGFSWSSVSSRYSHPPTIPRVFHIHGWAYNFISPGQARNHHAHPRPAARTPPASNGPALPSHWPAPGPAMARPSPHTGPHPALPSHRPAPADHGPSGQARSPTRRTATLPQHAQDSQAQYGSTSGCSPRIHSALRSRPQIALTRLGPAPLTRITHRPNWGNPFATHTIDLSHGAKGYSHKWVARLTRLQEPPSPSRSEATARFRPGSRMQTPGGTHAEL
jgi:hypothetical protein